MATASCLVTLGDPWSNIEQVRHECAFLGLDDWEARLEAMCRAELEQAQGRLRTVHRSRPARALHVGAVAPGGAGWAQGKVKVERTAVGRTAPPSSMSVGELRDRLGKLGTRAEAAARLGVTPRALARYLADERGVPESLAGQLRALAG